MGTTLSLDEMKRFVEAHFEEFVNKRNATVIRQNMTPDFYDHDGPGAKPADADDDEQMMRAMYTGMPDLSVTVEETIAQGDKIVCRNVWRYTDRSGKKMEFHGFVLWRFEDGKIAERWATVSNPAEETRPVWTRR
jgi:ketosteroid isomerase-like protein